MRSRINATKKALTAEFLAGKFPIEANSFAYLGAELLEDLANKNYSYAQKEIEMHIIALGALAIASAIGQLHRVPSVAYPLSWEDLWKKFELDQLSVDENNVPIEFAGNQNPLYVVLILRVGTQIMNQKLPLEAQMLQQVFPDMAAEISAVSSNIDKRDVNRPFVSSFMLPAVIKTIVVDRILNEALGYCEKNIRDHGHTHAMLKFVTELRNVRNYMNDKMGAGNDFDYEMIHFMAGHLRALAHHAANNTLQLDHINVFDRSTRSLRTDKKLAVLLGALIGAAIAVAAAIATLGLAIPAVALGAAAAGGLASGAMCTLWHKRKKDPQIQFVEAAKALEKSQSPRR